jgi:hypothetical protein
MANIVNVRSTAIKRCSFRHRSRPPSGVRQVASVDHSGPQRSHRPDNPANPTTVAPNK